MARNSVKVGGSRSGDVALRVPITRRAVPARRRVQLVADGTTRVTRDLVLPGNALVETYTLKVTAARADSARAVDVADVRLAVAPGDEPGLVVDFGVMRTVNALLLPVAPTSALDAGLFLRDGGGQEKVYPWLGTQFATEPVVLPSDTDEFVQRTTASGDTYDLFVYPMPETRTERLMLVMGLTDTSDASLESAAQLIELSLPELPAGLALRIDGGPPVWEHAAAVQLGEADVATEDGWTADGERLVPLAEAIAEFAGDATVTEDLTLSLELTSTVPGRLALDLEEESLQLLHRVSFGEGDSLGLEFEQEGEQGLDVRVDDGSGAARPIRGLRLTLAADLPPDRVLPALGPDPSGIGDLVIGSGRAACVRLDGIGELAELLAVRLPLRTGAGGAEAQVVLWRDNGGTPAEPLPEGASDPVTLEAEGEQWFSFAFPAPIVTEPGESVWAALVASRGELSWSLGAPSEPASERAERPLRIGAPEGPWRALPAAFGPGTSLGQVAGRFRLGGRAADTQPIDPLRVEVPELAAEQTVAPVPNGVRVEFESPDAQGGAAAARLVLVSHVPGLVTLSEVDAVTDA